MAKASMGSKLLVMLVLMFGWVYSDISEDKKECGNQLTSLSTCLPFVGGDTKTPTSTCCTILRKEINKTKKCLCILVKDRNDPNLGFKLNASLALSLPSICHAPSNVSDCPEILHLPPNSPDAQVFEQFAATNNNSSAIVAGNRTSSSSRLRGRKWHEMSIAGGIMLAVLIIIFTL